MPHNKKKPILTWLREKGKGSLYTDWIEWAIANDSQRSLEDWLQEFHKDVWEEYNGPHS